MSWAERKAQRLMVPWFENTPDAKGFWNYVRDHYERCIEMSWLIAKNHGNSEKEIRLIANVILDKLASPLVYLYEAWNVLPSEVRVKFNPELAEIKKKAEKLAEKVFQKEV